MNKNLKVIINIPMVGIIMSPANPVSGEGEIFSCSKIEIDENGRMHLLCENSDFQPLYGIDTEATLHKDPEGRFIKISQKVGRSFFIKAKIEAFYDQIIAIFEHRKKFEIIPLKNPGKIILRNEENIPEFSFDCDYLLRDKRGNIFFSARGGVELLEGACSLCYETDDNGVALMETLPEKYKIVLELDKLSRVSNRMISIDSGGVKFLLEVPDELLLLELMKIFIG